VDRGKLVFGCNAGFDEGKVAELFRDQIMDHAEPVRTLGMAVARVVLQVSVVFDDGEGAHNTDTETRCQK
jgi:hypothetical protein